MSDELMERAQAIIEREGKVMRDRTPRSAALFERATASMPLGVASSFQAAEPWPIYLERGEGSHVWDVDGNEYVDYHSGFGVNAVGHAHPKVVEAVTGVVRRGTHFAVTTELTVAFAEELCRRFGLDQVRFCNSGTEATMDAIRVARAFTGRDKVLKIEGSYHGHHDTVMFSVVPDTNEMGNRENPLAARMSDGIPAHMADDTLVVPYNDTGALVRMFVERAPEIACLIMEPVMMNIGLVLPDPDYLASVRRICTEHDVVLIFDEVKCGATIAAGGATELYGVQPDLACFAKAIGGGTPTAAFGGRAEVMDVIAHGTAQQGTFNGNPLVAAAGLAALTEVLTPEAYEHLAALGKRLADGCRAAITAHGIPANVVDLGCKGCVCYRHEPLRNFRDFLETNATLFAASWAWVINRGIFMTPGDEEQWTISVQHTEADIDHYIEVFGAFCAELAG